MKNAALLLVGCGLIWTLPALGEGPLDFEYRQADKLFTQHQYASVLPHVNTIIDLIPDNPNALALRGKTLLELERVPEATIDLKKALSIDPKLLTARRALARCDYESGKFDDAIKEISIAIAQDQPTQDKCYHLRTRAEYYMRIGKYKEALVDANKAFQYETSYGNYRIRADIYMLMKQYELASKDYTKSIQLGHKHEADKLYALRARAYDAMGRKDLAAKDRKTAGHSLDQDPMYFLLHP
jgi:tetratricopeptide (TPR) repeat protein